MILELLLKTVLSVTFCTSWEVPCNKMNDIMFTGGVLNKLLSRQTYPILSNKLLPPIYRAEYFYSRVSAADDEIFDSSDSGSETANEQVQGRNLQEENEEQAVDKNFDYLDEEATNTENMGIDSKRKRRDDLFLQAAMRGNNNLVNSLLDDGADISVVTVDEDGKNSAHMSALSLAVSEGHLYTVSILLNRGADVNRRTKDDYTPLMIAARYKGSPTRRSIQILNRLLDKGADLEAKNKQGLTPLMIACFFDNTRTIEALIKRGANVCAVDNALCSAIWYAAYHSNIKAMNLLKKSGADFDARDSIGQSLLQSVAIEGNLKMVKYLVEKGCDIKAEDKNGLTAFDYAMQREHSEIAYYLSIKAEELAVALAKSIAFKWM